MDRFLIRSKRTIPEESTPEGILTSNPISQKKTRTDSDSSNLPTPGPAVFGGDDPNPISQKKTRTDSDSSNLPTPGPAVFGGDDPNTNTPVLPVESDSDHASGGEERCPRKQKKKYAASWEKLFSWIERKGDKAYCRVCNKSLTNNKSHLERHNTSQLHLDNFRIMRNQPKLDDVDKVKSSTKLNNLVKTAELRIVVFIMEHNLPFVLMPFLVGLIQAVATDSEIAKKLQCGRTKATSTTNTLLKNEGQSKLVNMVKVQPFSLIIDETTDVSTKKCLALVLRFYDFALGRVQDRFLSLLELQHVDAKSIHRTIIDFLEQMQIPLTNMIGFAADNASVMMGHKGGIVSHFKNSNPHLYVMGCICHSLHLCSSAASKHIPPGVETLARNIFLFFSHSAKRQQEFRELQELFHEKTHKILKTSQTRWLSLGSVVNRIIEQWSMLERFFITYEIERNADLAHLISHELNHVNKLYMLFLSYIVRLTDKINIEFQSQETRVHVLLPTVETYIQTIMMNFVKSDRIHLLNKLDFADKNIYLDVDNIDLGLKANMFSKSGKIGNIELREIKQSCRRYYIELCQQIFKRINFEDEALIAIQTINPKNLGNNLTALISLFPNLAREEMLDELDCEWKELKLQKVIDTDLPLEEYWRQVFSLKNGHNTLMYPNIKEFVSAILSFPHSSATAERVFSQLNLIKNKQRNSLQVSTVNSIMIVKDMLLKTSSLSWNPSQNLLNEYHKY